MTLSAAWTKMSALPPNSPSVGGSQSSLAAGEVNGVFLDGVNGDNGGWGKSLERELTFYRAETVFEQSGNERSAVWREWIQSPKRKGMSQQSLDSPESRNVYWASINTSL